MFKRMRSFLVLAMLLTATMVSAQVTTASMSGKVVDVSNEPLIGATIRAVHTPTGTTYNTVTQSTGQYQFQNLRIGGPYTVEISYVGFNPEKLSNINLVLGENHTLNVTMREDAQALGEVLVVADRSSVISSNRTGAQEIITRDKMDKMPSLSHSLTDFTKLTPMSSGSNFLVPLIVLIM